MLLKKTHSLRSVIASCTLICGFISNSWAESAPLKEAAVPESVFSDDRTDDAQKPVVAAEPAIAVEPTVVTETVASAKNWSEVVSSLPTGIKLKNTSLLNQLYTKNQMQPFWTDKQAVQSFQQQFATLALSGVNSQFTQWGIWLANPALTGIERDVVLSDALLGYMHFVANVPANGRIWLYGNGAYKAGVTSNADIARWQDAYKQQTLPSYIDSLAPQHPQYAKMRDALKQVLSHTDNTAWPKLQDTVSLKTGAYSNDVPALREILKRTGMLSADAKPLAEEPLPMEIKPTTGAAANIIPEDTAADIIAETTETVVGGANKAPDVIPERKNMANYYSEDLVAAVKRFQEWQGLKPDGVIGARTREWLNTPPQIRAGLLALNIQRLRLLPGNPQDAILVNIPNYSLIYYRNGAEVLTSRVIVGSPKRKTPLMDSALNNVVVNPPWNVPTKLIREDIVPKAKRDPNYLRRLNYTVYSGWNSGSYAIDPSSINWQSVSSSNFPYRLQQAPGKSNALGRFKFNMPNSDAIYLHDTPNHGLFEKDIRALSSGCIRVNKASDLANMLLQEAGWNTAKVSSTLSKGKTTYVNVHKKIPVELYYLTAWVGDNEMPQYRTDIYNYDKSVNAGQLFLAQAKRLL